MSNYAKYSQLVNLTTNYAKRMKYLSNRIFNEVARPTNAKSMKVVRIFAAKPLPYDKEIMNYYPRMVETGMLMKKLREYGLFRDEHQDFVEEMERKRRLRGKISNYKKRLQAEGKKI